MEAGNVFLTYEPTTTQIADIATKNVPRTIHERLCKLLFETEKPTASAVAETSPNESGVSLATDPEPGVLFPTTTTETVESTSNDVHHATHA